VSVPRYAAIVLSGGTGSRLGLAGGKQLAPLLGIPVLSWTLKALDTVDRVDYIVVVCPVERLEEYRAAAVTPLSLRTSISFAPSGDTRQASVVSGLFSLPRGFDVVIVHDGARPLIDSGTVTAALEVLDASPQADGVVIGHPAIDTVKVVENGWVRTTPDRDSLWIAQTPQIFRIRALESALKAADTDGFLGTDDSSVVERYGGRVLMHEGQRDNIKVTVNEDIASAEATLIRRSGGL